MSRYEEIETFVRIVESGSITSAAKQMRVAKSAVSRRLKELEFRLDAQLLNRSTRKLTLTDTGRTLYERAVGLLSDWEEIEAFTRDSQCALSGTIRLAAPLSFGLKHLSPAILDFAAAHPEIKFDIDFNDRVVDLVGEGMDLAIRIGNLPDSNLIARKLAPIRTVASASPEYLREHGTPTHPDQLNQHKEIRYGNRREQGWTYTGPDGRPGRIDIPSTLIATNGEFLKDAAVRGHGIVIEPQFIVYEEIRNGKLVEILSDYQWPLLSAYAVYPHNRHLSRRVRAFVDFLVDRFKGVPYWEA